MAEISPPTSPPRGDIYCWLHKDRVCGGDCEAFDPFSAEDTSGKRTACRLVNSFEGMSKGLVTLARNTMQPMPGATLKPPGV